MAISSVLNPQNIIGNRQGTAKQFQNFMTGGNNSLGSSIVNSTSLNKIVPFERGVSGVRPVTPDFNNIISNISTRVDAKVDENLKNQDNKVEGVINNIQNVFQTTLQNFTKGYQENIKTQDIKTEGVINNIQNVFQTTLQNFTKGYQEKSKSIDENIKTQDTKTEGVINNIQNVFQTTIQNFTKGYQDKINSIEGSKSSETQDNKVQGVITNIQNTFQTTLQNFTKGYQDKIKSIEDSKPSGILEKFFGLYNNVTGFIQFFGDRKNLNKISDSLKGLRGLFEDSFETAKLIRKTINKIVKQLSSLPVASPSGGGGFNLDIKVPGSPLKNAAGKMLGGGRGKMLALGAGALGTGMLAGGAINALSGSENIQPAAVQQSIPENLADSLSSIVDRFVSAIDSLIKSASQKPKTTPSTSSGGGGGGGGGDTGGGDTGGGVVTATGSEQQKTEALIAGEEGVKLKAYQNPGDVPTIGYGETQGVRLGDTTTKEKAVVRLRSSIESHRKVAIKQVGAEKWNKLDENTKAVLTSIAYNYGSLPDRIMPAVKTGDSEKIAQSLSLLHGDNDGILKARREREAGFIRTGSSPKLDKDFLPGGKLSADGTSAPQPQPQPPTKPSPIKPAPTQTQANQAKAAAISQPVKPQANITTLSMPPQVSSAGGQSQGGGGGGGGVSAPPPPSGGSPSVPFLPAGNVDNFLVLYSKMVYNIVDG